MTEDDTELPAAAAPTPALSPPRLAPPPPDKTYLKYKPIVTTTPFESESDFTKLDRFLETEKTSSHHETWNKLDKGIKMQKLHIYAEHYARENKFPIKDTKALKQFFSDCLNKNKLQKTKDVMYDKTTGAIQNIPALSFHAATKHFTLKNLERVSTKNSLTPKRTTVNAPLPPPQPAAET